MNPPGLVDRGYSMAKCQRPELFAPAKQKRVVEDNERTCPQLDQGCEDRIQVPFGAGLQDMEPHSENAGRSLQVSQFALSFVSSRVDEHGNDYRRGNQFVRDLQSLRRYLHVKIGHARDVAARPVQTSLDFHGSESP
jgi:hypothetical protein